MDAEFFVQEAAGQVVDQDRAIAGAWGHETEREKKKHENKNQRGGGGYVERLQGREFLNSATSAVQRDQSEGVRVTALCVPCHCGKCDRGRASKAAVTKPTDWNTEALGWGDAGAPSPAPKTLSH